MMKYMMNQTPNEPLSPLSSPEETNRIDPSDPSESLHKDLSSPRILEWWETEALEKQGC